MLDGNRLYYEQEVGFELTFERKAVIQSRLKLAQIRFE